MSNAQKFGFLRNLLRRSSVQRGAEVPLGSGRQSGPGGEDHDFEIAKDRPEGIERARAAAEEGDSTAQNSFGLRFDSGQGVPRSNAEAAKWFRRAAQQGLSEAQFNLGRLLYASSVSPLPVGIGEARIEAYMWFHLAAAQGHLPAGALEETLNLQLTDAELHEGNRRAHVFQARKELPSNSQRERELRPESPALENVVKK